MAFDQLDALELDYGIGIKRVFPGSPADRGGLRQGDILVEIDGRPVYSVARLRWLIRHLEADKAAEVAYVRDGTRETTRISLPAPDTAAPRTQRDWSWNSPGYLGIRLQSLTDGLREAFDVPQDAGALVAEVYPDSAAARAGLQAGDVIVRMDRRTVRRLDDVQRVLDYFGPGEPFDVEIIRDKQKKTLTVELDPPAGRDGDFDSRHYPGPGSLPFFAHPDWWRDIDRYLQEWREYWDESRDRDTREGRAL